MFSMRYIILFPDQACRNKFSSFKERENKVYSVGSFYSEPLNPLSFYKILLLWDKIIY